MRTTLDLPEELFRKVKAKAAMEGLTLKELLARYVQRGLLQSALPGSQRSSRSQLPVLKRKGKRLVPDLTPELRAQLEEEEDRAKFRRSFGR